MTKGSSIALTAAAAVVAIGLGLFVGAGMLSSRKSRLAREGWSETLGTYDEIMERYPTREANNSARQLEALTAKLGIEIAPRWEEDRERPSPETAGAHDAIRREMAAWLYRRLEQPRRDREPPPESAERFLLDRSAEVEAVRRHLLRSDVPRWKREVEKLFAAPVPNLTGHLELHKLLVADAQIRLGRGESDQALDDLEASWRLNLSLNDHPFLIVQLVSMTAARMQAGALRHMGVAPPEWSKRLADHDFRESFMTALAFEGWLWTRFDSPQLLLQESNPLMTAVAGLAGPYAEYCISDVSEAYRRRLEKLKNLRAFCGVDLVARGADLRPPVPRWNALGRIILSDLSGAVDRLASLEVDFELTVRLLELERARSAGDGSWPGSLPGAGGSTACPGDRWNYEAGLDGSMTLALSREVSWPTQKGLVLPTHFTIRP